jgi:hypothetical protein
MPHEGPFPPIKTGVFLLYFSDFSQHFQGHFQDATTSNPDGALSPVVTTELSRIFVWGLRKVSPAPHVISMYPRQRQSYQ